MCRDYLSTESAAHLLDRAGRRQVAQDSVVGRGGAVDLSGGKGCESDGGHGAEGGSELHGVSGGG